MALMITTLKLMTNKKDLPQTTEESYLPANITNDIDKMEDTTLCVKCGSCLSVCPVYKEQLCETFSPRGRYEIIQSWLLNPGNKKEPKITKRMKDSLHACLQCGACTDICPSGVQVDLMVRRARQMIGGGAGENTLFKMMSFRKAPDVLAKIGAKIPEVTGIALKIATLLGSREVYSEEVRSWARAFPPLATRPAIGDGLYSNKNGLPTVALFTGCVQNYLYPEVVWAIRRILEPHCRLIIPEGQQCCGLAAWSAGFVNEARRLAIVNMEVFNKIKPDFIVTGCASCAYFLSEFWHQTLPSGEMANSALMLSGKVREFTALLKTLDINQFTSNVKAKVSYHVPCHQRFHLGGEDIPLSLLNNTPGLEIASVEKDCCGQGGLFGFKHPKLSMQIFSHRLQSVKSAGAEAVITNCSGCLLQWRVGMTSLSPFKSIPVFHPAEILISNQTP